MTRLSLSLLLLVCFVTAEDSPFILPTLTTHNVEYYDRDDIRYAFYLETVTWDMANRLCRMNNGTLLELTDSETSVFIGRALAESAISFGTLWVGGEYTPNPIEGEEGEWKWSSSKKDIKSKLEPAQVFPMNEAPYWVNRPNITSRDERCLATDRKLHNLPLIIDLPCEMERPFICTLPSATEGGKPKPIDPPLKVGKSEFHMFLAKYTWEEALDYCVTLNMKLARLTKAEEFTVISNRMRRSRPILENAWIGGQYTKSGWTWLPFNQLIVVNKEELGEAEPFPWYRPDEIINEGCLLADRHVCDYFVYVEAKCDRRRSFICQTEFHDVEGTNLVKVDENNEYWISVYKDTWMRAQNACSYCVDGHLLQLSTKKEDMDPQFIMLFKAMALTFLEEVRHVWLGGYLFNEVFKWTNTSQVEPTDPGSVVDSAVFESLMVNGEMGTLTFEQIDFKVDKFLLEFECLNLDREDQKNFFMYGLACGTKQHFICKAKAVDTQIHEECKYNHFLKKGPKEVLHQSNTRRPAAPQTHGG